jgi:hypothetical protein
MTKARIAIMVMLGVVVVAIGAAYLYNANLHRVHEENLAKAERFNQEFSQYLSLGAPWSAVDEYLRSHSVLEVLPQSRGDKTEYWITLTRERSVVFGCGEGSVGLVMLFGSDRRLEGVRVSSWSMDCL